MINYAPYIEGTLPAFASTIEIPFKMNPAVSASQVKGFLVKFLSLDGKTIGLQSISTEIQDMIKKNALSFQLRSGLASKITVPNFYKVQIAYMDTATWSNGEIYAYSTVGVIKRTKAYASNPTWINSGEYTNNLQFNSYKMKIITYDVNEPIYKYRFRIKNSKETTVYNSGYQLHNVETDQIKTNSSGVRYREATLFCETDKVLSADSYTVHCDIETVNGYNCSRKGTYTKASVKENKGISK